MQTTDYSPELKISAEGNRVFEMRTLHRHARPSRQSECRFRDQYLQAVREARHDGTSFIGNLMADQKGLTIL